MGFCFSSLPIQAQKTLAPGPQYERSSFHQWLWGKHYRKEWATPVTAPLFYLDTAAGGLKPYQSGGGRQTKSIRLHDANEKEYVIRSVDKTFSGALPSSLQNTFVEKIINDQVSLGHPYAGVMVPVLAQAAKVYYTDPRIVYIPQQPALDTFNQEYGDRLYTFEQRPDGNWEEAANFGNSKKIVGTEKMMENVMEKNDHRIDQKQYIRSRILDMLIGDGSRHEDQWRWGSFKEEDRTIYKAIPRDRDQAFARFDGWLLNKLLSAADINHLQTFGPTIPDVRTNNFPARNLDRFAANEPAKEDWVSAAREIRQLLADEIIEKAVKQMPPEVFPISGNSIISDLKSRRDHLEEYAADYYSFLAKEVEIVGSKENERFWIKRMPGGETTVTVFAISKKGEPGHTPSYTRTFHPGETKEIRLYGLSGHDVYQLEGEGEEGITVRIIGGTDKDSIIDQSLVNGHARKTLVYDNHDNNIISSKETKLNLSADSAVHAYKYDGFKYNSQGLSPVLFYSFEDKLYVGLSYKLKKHGWRKDPYKSKQNFQVNYSLLQKAFSFLYNSDFKNVMGAWHLGIDANYDLMRWTNYFGLGNETTDDGGPTTYYRLRSKDLLATIQLYRPLDKHVTFSIGPAYNSVDLRLDPDHYAFQSMPDDDKLFERKHFAGGQASLTFSYVDHPVVPTKGFYLATGAQYLQNLKEDKHLWRYDAQVQLFVPLLKNLILAIRPAAATMTGQPEFYQHVSIGGTNTLRGYARDRFRGTSSFYSDNELQWLFIKGSYGLTGFYDIGRVWQKGEISSTWHRGYGAGIIVAPFKKIMASLTLGRSKEGDQIHVRLYKKL